MKDWLIISKLLQSLLEIVYMYGGSQWETH